jgi:hypothetical protein
LDGYEGGISSTSSEKTENKVFIKQTSKGATRLRLMAQDALALALYYTAGQDAALMMNKFFQSTTIASLGFHR